MTTAVQVSQREEGFWSKVRHLMWTDERREKHAQESLAPLVPESAVVDALERSFTEWTPGADEEDPDKLLQERDRRWKDWSASQTPRTVSCLLPLTVASKQIEWALEESYAAAGTRLLEREMARQATARQYELKGKPRTLPFLEIQVSVKLKSIRIPDAARDEIAIDVTIASGIALQDLLKFLVEDEAMSEEEAAATQERWEKAGEIAPTPEEKAMLDRCLRVTISDTLERKEEDPEYNVGYESGLFWRVSDESLILAKEFDLAIYPFDTQIATLQMGSWGAVDCSGLALVPDSTVSQSLDAAHVAVPRGFKFLWATPALVPAGTSMAADMIPMSVLKFGFAIRRRPNTFIWRTLAPSVVVMALIFLGAAYAFFSGRYVESIMTQAIPATLVAFVALQLTAAQSVPAHSGRTLEDLLFLSHYGVLFLLFFSLLFRSSLAAGIALGLAAVLFLACVTFYTVLALKALFARK